MKLANKKIVPFGLQRGLGGAQSNREFLSSTSETKNETHIAANQDVEVIIKSPKQVCTLALEMMVPVCRAICCYLETIPSSGSWHRPKQQ